MSKLEKMIMELCQDGVEYKKLGDIGRIGAGGDVPKDRFPKEQTDEYNVPIYSNGIDEKALYGFTDVAKINEPCVTVSARGTIGYATLHEKPIFPIIRLITIVPNENVNVRYLKYAIDILDIQVPMTGIPQLTVPMLSKYKIPLPPLPVQSKIVEILDNFTELTARKKQYEYYRDNLMLFGDDVPQVELGEIATEMYRGSGIKRDQVKARGTPCVRYGEIYTTYGIWFEKCVSHTNESGKTFEHGDVLFAITGESVEEIAKSTVYVGYEKCLAGGDIVVMKHEQNPKYMSYVLSTFSARKQKSAGKIKSKVVHSNIPSLKSIVVPLPSLEEQSRIVEILDKFDALTTDISAGLPAEIEARRKQYEYYRDKLLAFRNINP